MEYLFLFVGLLIVFTGLRIWFGVRRAKRDRGKRRGDSYELISKHSQEPNHNDGASH
ncbi:hypothetical protein [Rossellomorea aquimaris]|uniref:hypothetical protein n=1 Tax=Rossellomorea aquimaris TaxID=189382 RepID=UPI000A489D69|nr:hypothetical protein [Rossellomorea aquimaris]